MSSLKNFEELEGKILKEISGTPGDTEMFFTLTNDEQYVLYNDEASAGNDVQVTINDICGNINDLIGSPILLAEEVTSKNKNPESVEVPDSQYIYYTWTFYKLSTIKGSITIRWYGESNGHYSETVDFRQVS